MDLIWVNAAKCYPSVDIVNSYNFLHHNHNNFDDSIYFYRSRRNGAIIPDWAEIPDHAGSSQSFQDIMDGRALDILAVSREYKEIFITWSGGIDSTAVVAALLKHATNDFLEHAHLVLNQESIWENPYFYLDHVRGKFKKVINSKEFDAQCHVNDLIITGDLGDRIMGSNMGVNWYLRNHGCGQGSYKNDADQLIRYFESRIKDPKIAQEIYELMHTSAESSGLDIVTAYDLLWWFSFDSTWIDIRLEKFLQFQNPTKADLDAFLKNHVAWFDSREFQIWSMQNLDSLLKFDTTRLQHKKALRDYIYDLDRNDWYYQFKNKTKSSNNAYEFRKSLRWILAIDVANNIYRTTDIDFQHDYEDLVKSI